MAAVSFWIDPRDLLPFVREPLEEPATRYSNLLLTSRRPQGCQLQDWSS